MIYKHGKGHRVLVCPHCGVLATNPTLAGNILRGAVSSIPIVGGVASGIIGGIQDKNAEKKPEIMHTKATHDKAYYDYKRFLYEEAMK